MRIDIKQGQVQATLPKIEQQLTQCREWWQLREQGETVVVVPDTELLVRAFITALDIAREARRVLGHWQNCLDLLSETETVKQAYGESEYALARTRFNRCNPLVLGKK